MHIAESLAISVSFLVDTLLPSVFETFFIVMTAFSRNSKAHKMSCRDMRHENIANDLFNNKKLLKQYYYCIMADLHENRYLKTISCITFKLKYMGIV